MSYTRNDLTEAIARADEFLRQLDGPVWSYVLNRAQDEIDRAMEEFRDVDPGDTKEVQRIQNIIIRNQQLGLWLQEVLEEGQQARELLESHDNIKE